ncbi:MAG: carboxypeptidase regulatory-like domain-containing protein [Ilumatobacteraceae bacterium]
MKTAAWPEIVEVAPGATGFLSIAVTNSSSVIDAYRVQVFGLDPSWVDIEPSRLSLFPGDTANVSVNVRLPADYPASRRALTVNVASEDDPGSFALSQVELSVEPSTKTSVHVDPTMITAGKRATFSLVVGNVGNAAVSASAYAVDPEDLAEFTFEPRDVVVAPGREQVIEITAEGGRSWFGSPRPRTFTFGVHAEDDVAAMATFIQRPRIGRWMLTLLGLLTAAAVFAAVLSRSFDRVVQEAQVSTDVLDAALSTGGAGGAVVPANPGTVTGSLVSRTTGAGFSGATAELFVASDFENPVSTAATDDNGAFTFANLGRGTYLLRLSGSGVNQIWYGNSATAADAEPFQVALGEATALDPIEIGGIPVEVSGSVDIDDPSGVVIQLIAPGQADSGSPGVVATVDVGPDGTFVLPDIPSPGAYEMVVSKPGFATETRGLVLEPGQPLDGVEITLRAGNGLIEGVVSGATGPLGGVTVAATDGTNSVETVSLTEGNKGEFTLRDLAVPGQYTVTFTHPDYATEARTINLATDSPTSAFNVTLAAASGSVQGRALLNGSPARGLSVTISGGDVNRTTAIVSQGSLAGSYEFTNLPAPRTYTLTFSGANTIPQVRVVDLNPANGTQNVTGIDVSLSPDTTTVDGLVRDVGGAPAAQATVRLTDGANELVLLTSDEPSVGRFAFTGIEPGSYTLTASRVGTIPVVVLVNVTTAGLPAPIEVQLGRQASLLGRVIPSPSHTGRAYTVRLYDPALFPVTPRATTQTDPTTGTYTFDSLDAPENYVVAVFDGPNAPNAIDSEVVRTEPGLEIPVPDFDLSSYP